MVLILDGNSNMLRTYEGKKVFSKEENNQILDCRRSEQLPYTDQIIEITPHVRTCIWITITYKYHDQSWFANGFILIASALT